MQKGISNKNEAATPAQHAYADASERLGKALAILNRAIDEHDEAAEKHPTYWTFVGDFNKAERDVLELAAFLGSVEANEHLYLTRNDRKETR